MSKKPKVEESAADVKLEKRINKAHKSLDADQPTTETHTDSLDMTEDMIVETAEEQELVEVHPMHESAESLIKSHAMIAMAAGLVPVPAVDIGVMIGNQVKMVHGLSKLYNVPFNENMVKSTIASLVAGSIPTGSMLALSATKLLPGVGTLVGSGGVSVLGGAVTYAVGRVFAAHFESGGTLLTIDMSFFKERFKLEFLKARKEAKEKKEKEEAAA